MNFTPPSDLIIRLTHRESTDHYLISADTYDNMSDSQRNFTLDIVKAYFAAKLPYAIQLSDVGIVVEGRRLGYGK